MRCSWRYLVVDCHFGNKGAEEEAARSGHDGVATDPCTHAPTGEGRRYEQDLRWLHNDVVRGKRKPDGARCKKRRSATRARSIAGMTVKAEGSQKSEGCVLLGVGMIDRYNAESGPESQQKTTTVALNRR
jgi:hypothetical protein